MKSILLIRHAKSNWNAGSIEDFDRPLNERGDRDAPMMAKRLLDKGVLIDAFVTSNAVRALSTAKYFQQEYKAKDERLIEVPGLYHGSVSIFYAVINQLKNDWNCVAIFSHNPGISQMVNSLGLPKIESMPTCAIFGVHADIDNWADFKSADKQFWIYDYPKRLP